MTKDCPDLEFLGSTERHHSIESRKAVTETEYRESSYNIIVTVDERQNLRGERKGYHIPMNYSQSLNRKVKPESQGISRLGKHCYPRHPSPVSTIWKNGLSTVCSVDKETKRGKEQKVEPQMSTVFNVKIFLE